MKNRVVRSMVIIFVITLLFGCGKEQQIKCNDPEILESVNKQVEMAQKLLFMSRVLNDSYVAGNVKYLTDDPLNMRTYQQLINTYTAHSARFKALGHATFSSGYTPHQLAVLGAKQEDLIEFKLSSPKEIAKFKEGRTCKVSFTYNSKTLYEDGTEDNKPSPAKQDRIVEINYETGLSDQRDGRLKFISFVQKAKEN